MRKDTKATVTLSSRRSILKALLATGALGALRPADLFALDLASHHLPRGGKQQRIIVVGAGMAGLVAALELQRAGHDVIVLEARASAGGRVRTLRTPFSGDLYAEAGAARIPDSHELTHHYTAEFGLELAPFMPTDTPSLVHIAGKNYRSDDPAILHQLGCTPKEQALGPIGAMQHFGARALDAIGDLGDSNWPTVEALKYDRFTGTELFKKLGMSDGLIRFFDLGFGVLSELSGLELLVQLESLMSSKSRIVGGNDRLANAIAAKLGQRVRYDAAVESVSQSGRGVVVRHRTVTGHQTISGDRAIIAVPLPVLRHMHLEPSLSRSAQRSIEQIRYAVVTRVFAEVGRRFWETDGSSGFAVTDHPIEIFEASFGQHSDRGLLTGYLHEDIARRVTAKGPIHGAADAIGMMRDVYPALADEVDETAMFSWHTEPYALGAVALWQPGDIGTAYRHTATNYCRIHFAGEHTSPWHAWIQGAVHSGRRAAAEAIGV